MQREDQKTTLNQQINGFIQKNRTPLLAVLILLVVSFVGFIVSYSAIQASQKKASGIIEALITRYEALLPGISEGESSAEIDTLINDLNDFAKKSMAAGYSGGKAYGLIADIYKQQNQPANAQAAWVSAAGKAKKTFYEPLSWFNAGATAEEQGNNEQAIEYYTKSLGTQANFPAAVQAQFSVARLKEVLNDRDGAIDAYRALISGWPQDTVWTNLAFSRIVALEAASQ